LLGNCCLNDSCNAVSFFATTDSLDAGIDFYPYFVAFQLELRITVL